LSQREGQGEEEAGNDFNNSEKNKMAVCTMVPWYSTIKVLCCFGRLSWNKMAQKVQNGCQWANGHFVFWKACYLESIFPCAGWCPNLVCPFKRTNTTFSCFIIRTTVCGTSSESIYLVKGNTLWLFHRPPRGKMCIIFEWSFKL